jgi:hypothetical protein
MTAEQTVWELYKLDIAVELYEVFYRAHPIPRHFNHTISFQPVDDREHLARTCAAAATRPGQERNSLKLQSE